MLGRPIDLDNTYSSERVCCACSRCRIVRMRQVLSFSTCFVSFRFFSVSLGDNSLGSSMG